MASLEELMAKVSEIQGKLLSQSQALEAEQAELKKLRDEEKTLERQLYEQRTIRASKEIHISSYKKGLSELKDLMQGIQHEMQKVQVETATKEREKAKEAEYTEIIEGARWRDKLFDHQLFGAKFGANARRWICGDTVGLGKTPQAVAWLDLVQAKKILIITPKNLTKNFMDHVQDWSNGRHIIPVVGLPREKRDLMLPIFRETMKEYVVVVNYEAWFQDRTILDLLMHMQFDTIICDEAHKLKNSKTASFVGVNKLTYFPNNCTSCGHYDLLTFENKQSITKIECLKCGSQCSAWEPELRTVKNVLLMSGTAIKNRPQDIFTLLNLVNLSAFPSEREFLSLYCRQTESGRWTWKSGGEDSLTRAISPFYLRRKRSDTNIKVPPQREIKHVVKLDPEIYPEQFQAYKTLRELSKVVIDNTEENENRSLAANAMITYLLRLRQMVSLPSGIRYFHPKTKELLFQCEVRESVKIDKAMEIMEDLVDNGSRVLLFAKFTPPIDELKLRLEAKGISVCVLDGRTKQAERSAISRNFDLKYVEADGGPKWDVALCNYGVGSEGLTLTDATDTILLDPPWSPAEREQATGRTDRIGQIRETTIHQIYCDVWIDEWMEKLNELKEAITQGFEDSVEFMQIARDGLMSNEF